MKYEKIENDLITYDQNDIIGWAKVFAARQLGLSPDEIKEEDISVVSGSIEDLNIVIKHSKITSNIKENSISNT